MQVPLTPTNALQNFEFSDSKAPKLSALKNLKFMFHHTGSPFLILATWTGLIKSSVLLSTVRSNLDAMEKVTMKILAALFTLVVAAGADPAVTNEAQRQIALKFPYYFTGTNKLGQSIYMIEFGKWDTRSMLKESSSVEPLDEFYTKFYTTMVQDGLSAGSNGSILVIDAKGLDVSQTEDPTVRNFYLKQSAKLDEMNKDKAIKLVYVVNANKAFLDLYKDAKPSLNATGDSFKIYSQNVTEWCSNLLSYLHLDVKTRSGLSGVSPLQALLDEEFPIELRSKFPYYLSGYTADGSPMFITPLGKYEYKSTIDQGPESAQQLSQLMSQMFLRMYTSGLKAPGGRGAVLIADLKGISEKQTDTSAIREHMLNYYSTMDKINAGPGLKKLYYINASPTAYKKFHADADRLLVNTKDKIQVFYQDQDYRSALREEVKTPIPEEYGGTGGYSPLVSY